LRHYNTKQYSKIHDISTAKYNIYSKTKYNTYSNITNTNSNTPLLKQCKSGKKALENRATAIGQQI
jgi:hypothetical protein